jgi:alpha-tubulin suppressor-like RCC1 family protein
MLCFRLASRHRCWVRGCGTRWCMHAATAACAGPECCAVPSLLVQVKGECVVLAVCGTSHSVLLMGSGAVYTAGCNSTGQCGQDLQQKEVCRVLVERVSRCYTWICDRNQCSNVGAHSSIDQPIIHTSRQQVVHCKRQPTQVHKEHHQTAYSLCSRLAG